MERKDRFACAQPVFAKKIKTFAENTYRMLPGFDREDLEAEYTESLWKACCTYDPNNGAVFNTYFWQIARNRFKDILKSANRDVRKINFSTYTLDPVSLYETIESRYLSPGAEEEALARITVQERRISLNYARQKEPLGKKRKAS